MHLAHFPVSTNEPYGLVEVELGFLWASLQCLIHYSSAPSPCKTGSTRMHVSLVSPTVENIHCIRYPRLSIVARKIIVYSSYVH